MIEPTSRPVLRPLPRWVIVVGLPLMVLVAAGAVWVLLGTGAGGDQLDAIRTGSALGVGLGGIVVLWLAARRQRSTELDLLQKYEAHQLAERVAAAGERDATARRITDLYAKAVDQLGSDKAPVRLGGLYALERLAQDNVDRQLRQTVVNMICAYLRMPSLAEEPHEREVRLTAQRILENHLRPGPDHDDPVSTFWSGIDLDLTGAVLADLNLSGARIRAADFRHAMFTGQAMFDNSTFGQTVRFSDAEFSQQADFTEVAFAGFADFKNTAFCGDAWFDGVEFGRDADFDDAKFAKFALFRKSHFTRHASFDKAEFTGTVDFARTVYNSDAWFDQAMFASDANFLGASFGNEARFEGTRFGGPSDFDKVTFGGGATFESATFAANATFAAIARVDGVESDKWWWPEGWVPDGEPSAVEGQEGLWVSLVPVEPA